MGKSKSEKPEEQLVSVPAKIVGQYGWLTRMKSNLRTRGELAERVARARSEVKESPTFLVRHYLRFRQGEDKLKAMIGATAEKLRDLWAKGLTKVDGVTISPVVELSLPYDEVTAELDAETAARVISHEPVLDVAELIRLANTDPKLQALIERHLRSKFTIEVKRVAVAAVQ